jgi:hypothetical protein
MPGSRPPRTDRANYPSWSRPCRSTPSPTSLSSTATKSASKAGRSPTILAPVVSATSTTGTPSDNGGRSPGSQEHPGEAARRSPKPSPGTETKRACHDTSEDTAGRRSEPNGCMVEAGTADRRLHPGGLRRLLVSARQPQRRRRQRGCTGGRTWSSGRSSWYASGDSAESCWRQEVTDGRGKAVGQATDSLSVGRGFGAAIDRDGTLIIPVAWVACGGGAGGADVSTQNQPDGDDPRRQDKPDGGGGGFGGFTWPLGVYVVKNGEVRLGAGCRCYSCRSGRDCPRPHGGEALGRQPRESTGLTVVDRARHELHPEKSIH